MTVIALFPKLQVALADVLLTVKGHNVWPYLPTAGYIDVCDAALYSRHPVILARKVAKVRYNGLVSSFLISGRIKDVERFMQDVQDLADGTLEPTERYQRMHPRTLERIFEEAIFEARDSARAILGFVGIRDNKFFSAPSINGEVPYFGEVHLAGSGTEGLLTWLITRGIQYLERFPNDSEDIRRARLYHDVPMALMADDRLSPSPTLGSGVGGFYEVYGKDDQNLVPQGHDGWVRTFGILGRHIRDPFKLEAVYCHRYDGEKLEVLSAPQMGIAISHGKPARVPFSSFKAHSMSPFSDGTTHQEFDVAKLLPRLALARHHTVRLSGGPLKERSCTSFSTKRRCLFSYSKEGSELVISLREREYADILRELHKELA